MIYQHIWDFFGRELLRTVSAYPVWLTETSDLPNHNRFDPKGSRCPAFPCENYLVQTNKHLLDLNKLVVQQARLSFEISPCVCVSLLERSKTCTSVHAFCLLWYFIMTKNKTAWGARGIMSLAPTKTLIVCLRYEERTLSSRTCRLLETCCETVQPMENSNACWHPGQTHPYVCSR